MNNGRADIMRIVSGVLKIPVERLPADASADTLSEWDSMAQLNICMRFQERFNIEMDIDRIETCTSVTALVALLP